MIAGRLVLGLVAALLTVPARAAEPVRLYAAGSLQGSLTEAAAAFQAATGIAVTGSFGPSGMLKDRLAGGEAADLFASANLDHPKALAAAAPGRVVVPFVRNRLCGIGRPGFEVTAATLLDRMLDPAVRLGTSTPRADPSGDYAWALFAKAEAVRPGARALLEAKALQLVGGPSSPPPPADGRSAYGDLFRRGLADLFLGYCTTAATVSREMAGVTTVEIPPALAVGADYGLVVLSERAEAHRFALFLLSIPGQAILARHGFSAPGRAE